MTSSGRGAAAGPTPPPTLRVLCHDWYRARFARSGMNRTLSVATVAGLVAMGLSGVAAGEHPQGEQQVAFDHKTGNEWWVEVLVSPQPHSVQARDTGGDWKTLTLRDWGAWAASFHIEPGHDVQFRAAWSDGSAVESCWFTHPDGVETCETTPPPPPSGAFTFDHKSGNEWWVEALISPAPRAAQARDTGGDWRTLTLRDWGAWAASFHIDPGHDVQFRAQDAGGAWHESCWFTHPDGIAQCEEPPTPPPSGEFDATFHDPGGNEWWAQVEVDANAPLAAVDARVVGDEWHALTLRDWGAWAASFHVPDGSRVEFRATSTDGEVDLSGRYSWPDGTLVAPPPDTGEWPREGSYVRFEATDMGASTPGGSEGTDWKILYRYVDGAWERTCEGVRWSTSPVPGTSVERVRQHERGVELPRGPTDVAPGQRVDRVEWLEGCYISATGAVVEGHSERTVYRNEQPIRTGTWSGNYEASEGIAYASYSWDDDTGITLGWNECSGHYTGCDSGQYLDSDAPIQGEPQAESGWERHGAFAEYEVRHVQRDDPDWGDIVYDLTVTVRQEYGDWIQLTEGSVTFTGYDGNRTTRDCYDRTHAPPRLLPTDVQPGDLVGVTYYAPTWSASMEVVVKGTFDEQTTRDGEPFTARAWWGDEPDDVDAAGHDRDAWWDAKMGLLLRWERDEGDLANTGRLADTNAPLTAW